MTNDAMFHIIFEAYPDALKVLVGALLWLSLEKITSIEVTKPVIYDFSIYSKNFILDLKIILNEKTILNIEMQVESLSFWKECSLIYLCCVFDNLNYDDEYLNIKPAIQLSILDFTLAPDDTSFYSSYYMMNETTYKKYSDTLRLSVL